MAAQVCPRSGPVTRPIRGAKSLGGAASPTPVYAEGITAEILAASEPPVTPGYALELVRITFAPGAAIAAHRHSEPRHDAALRLPHLHGA